MYMMGSEGSLKLLEKEERRIRKCMKAIWTWKRHVMSLTGKLYGSYSAMYNEGGKLVKGIGSMKSNSLISERAKMGEREIFRNDIDVRQARKYHITLDLFCLKGWDNESTNWENGWEIVRGREAWKLPVLLYEITCYYMVNSNRILE